MAEPEGSLVRKWRGELTQKDLGDACPDPLEHQRVSVIETGPYSNTVETLLNVIRGLERLTGQSLGPDDQPNIKLARFFEGPDVEDGRRALAAVAQRQVSAGRQTAKLLKRLQTAPAVPRQQHPAPRQAPKARRSG